MIKDKVLFMKPEIEFVEFEEEAVITSGGGGGCDDDCGGYCAFVCATYGVCRNNYEITI